MSNRPTTIDNRRKSPNSFMPLWIADYLADTTHLNIEQHGCYLLLLMTYWRRQGPLPANDAYLASIVKVSPQKWRSLKVFMLEFFVEEAGTWKNNRADQEIAKAAVSHARRVAAGSKGAEIRYSGDSNAIAMPVATEQHSHSISQLTFQKENKSSNQDTQNLVEPLLVRAEPEPQSTPVSKPSVPKLGRGTRWPSGQAVPDEWIAAAATNRMRRGLAAIDLTLEAEKFTEYWTAKSGKDATKVDWRATWRMWSLNAYGAKANGKGQYGNGRSISDHPLGIFGEIGDQLRARREGGPTFDA